MPNSLPEKKFQTLKIFHCTISIFPIFSSLCPLFKKIHFLNHIGKLKCIIYNNTYKYFCFQLAVAVSILMFDSKVFEIIKNGYYYRSEKIRQTTEY